MGLTGPAALTKKTVMNADIVRSMKGGVVWIVGSRGSGKTFIAQAIASDLGAVMYMHTRAVSDADVQAIRAWRNDQPHLVVIMEDTILHKDQDPNINRIVAHHRHTTTNCTVIIITQFLLSPAFRAFVDHAIVTACAYTRPIAWQATTGTATPPTGDTPPHQTYHVDRRPTFPVVSALYH